MALSEEDGLLIAAVGQDPDLSLRAKSIADTLLSRIEKIVKTGNDQAVLTLASRVMPALVKVVGERGSDDNLKLVFEQMRADWRGSNLQVEVEPSITAKEDAPALDGNPSDIGGIAEGKATRAVGKGKPAKIRTPQRTPGPSRGGAR